MHVILCHFTVCRFNKDECLYGAYEEADAAGVILEGFCAQSQLLSCNVLLHVITEKIQHRL